MHRGLTPIVRAYDAVLYGMAWAAGFLMAAMMVVIFVDVVLRNLGYQSSAHFFTFTEYALLAVPCLGALCILVCAVLAWYGSLVTLGDFMQNEKDVRSLDMPRWIVVGFIPLSFA